MNTSRASVRVQRTIAAPPAAVYDAWLDPDVLRSWLAPGTSTVETVQVDPVVGGRLLLYQVQDGRRIGGFDARIVELVPDERIVFAWGLLGPDGTNGPVYDSRLTLTFRRASNGDTLFTLHHEHLDAIWAALPEIAGAFEDGWNDVLDKLSSALS